MRPDPLSDIISALVIDRFYLATLNFGGNWGLKFDDIGGIKFTVISKGSCCVRLADTGEVCTLRAGDCMLMTQGTPFSSSNSLQTVCVNPEPFKRDITPTEASYSNGGEEVLLQGGRFFFTDAHNSILSKLLPRFIFLRADEVGTSLLKPLLDRFVDEVRADRPGRALAIQNFAKMMVLEIMRFHMARGEFDGGSILAGLLDKRIGKAIHLIHERPESPWTVENLASECGMSRSNFAANFSALVGMGPVEYLTQWRMGLACSLLAMTTTPISELACKCGYASESAFSTAFRRNMHMSPRGYREQRS